MITSLICIVQIKGNKRRHGLDKMKDLLFFTSILLINVAFSAFLSVSRFYNMKRWTNWTHYF